MITNKHPYWLRLKDLATVLNPSEVQWIWTTYYYRLTNDPDMPQKIFNQIMQFQNTTIGADEFRGYVHDWIFAYYLLKSRSSLPQDQLEQMYKMIDAKVQYVLTVGTSYNVTATDSDNIRFTFLTIQLWIIINDKEGRTARRDYLKIFNQPIGMTGFPLGGLESTGADRTSFRNSMAFFVKLSAGGNWPEGSQYSLGLSDDYMMIDIINRYYGKDCFPEYTANIVPLLNGLMQSYTPDFSDEDKWGDIQQSRGLRLFTEITYLYTLAYFCPDQKMKAQANFLANKFMQSYTPANGGTQTIFPLPALNPYATPSENTLSGATSLNCSGVGRAFFHTGWNPDDTFIISGMMNKMAIDHQVEQLADEGIYRKKGWALTSPRGYADGNGGSAANGIALWGAVYGKAGSWIEAKGQVGYAADTIRRYLYHVGAQGGYLVPEKTYQPFFTPLDEHIRTHVYLTNTDGSLIAIAFDRLNTTDPRKRPNYDRWSLSDYKAGIEKMNACHCILHHIPNNQVDQSDLKRLNWTAPNGEKVVLYSYIPGGFTIDLIDEKISGFAGTMEDSEKHFTLRIKATDNKDGFRFYRTVKVIGSTVSIRPDDIVSDGGTDEIAQGVLLRDYKKMVIANATPKPTLPKDALRDYLPGETHAPIGIPLLAKYQPDKLGDLKKLRYFSKGFNINLNYQDYLDLFICDLDPALSWNVSVNGVKLPIVSNDGFGAINIPASAFKSGTNSLSVASAGVVITPVPPTVPPSTIITTVVLTPVVGKPVTMTSEWLSVVTK